MAVAEWRQYVYRVDCVSRSEEYISVGAVLALALADLIRNQIFGLNPHDPWTLVGASFSLAIAVGLAGFIPAVRASSVDPTQALRQE